MKLDYLHKYSSSYLLILILCSLSMVNVVSENHHNDIYLQQSIRAGDQLECSEPGSYRENIPSVDNPKFINIEEADPYLTDDDRIIGFIHNGQARAYPVDILQDHEVVNDLIDGENFGITYCPLTGSGIVYPLTNQLGNGVEIGVTGYLFENNLVFYDRETQTCYVQMLSFGISGVDQGKKLQYKTTIETTWSTWKASFPDSLVLSRETGFSEDIYDQDVYESYDLSDSIYYANSAKNQEPYNLYQSKHRTMIVEIRTGNVSTPYLFPHEELAKTPVLNLYLDNTPITVLYDESKNITYAFTSILNGEEIELEIVENIDFPDDKTRGYNVYTDGNGNIINFIGEIIDGPNVGIQLIPQPTFTSYWFAASIFFPNAQILVDGDFIQYQNGEIITGNFVDRGKLSPIDYIFGGIVIIVIAVLLFSTRKNRK